MPPKSDAEVVEILHSWLKTPYHHHGKWKGKGVDCIQFVHGVYVEAGWIEPVEFPEYNVRGQGKRNLHLLCDSIESIGDFDRIIEHDHFDGLTLEEAQDFPWKIGDVIIFSRGNQLHHAAIVGDNNWTYQALMRLGVEYTELFDPNWTKLIYRVYRLKSRNEA